MKTKMLGLLFTLLVSISMVFGQSNTDVKQSKQIKVIVAELDRVGKRINTVEKQIKILVNKISSNDIKLESLIDTFQTVASQNEIKQIKTDIEELNKEISNIKIESEPEPTPEQASNYQPDYQSKEGIHYSFVSDDADYHSHYYNEYNRALWNFNNGNYQLASDLFIRIRSNKNNDLADNAQYWLGECFYAQGFYRQAIAEFENVFTYNKKDKYDDAQLKLGYCYKKLRNSARAVEEFERFVQYYPYSEYYELALRELSYLR
ncbi:MAG: tetratricopeptide repeat protein [Candidatus Marinimicrobia bacterium]|jgi:TolA-binding protein|nr:tetratricopeptide repeat protein [Candidatus Neomarinimicrobiota bacterium]